MEHQRDSDEDNQGSEPQPGGGRPPDLATVLNQLFASLLNPHAIHGDGVYTQEALDRIITNLMEANPQSNAAAPASAEAIARLARKPLDEEMLGPELKGECTICIDDMGVGDMATVLPCRHWFHDECVVLWLKEHNTCPICRAAIDGDAAGQPQQASTSPAAQPPQAGPSGASAFTEASERRRANLREHREARFESIRELASPYERRQAPRRDSSSPPMHSSSQSPRFRSPSRSSQGDRGRDRGSSGNGPLHWLRDRFGGDRRS